MAKQLTVETKDKIKELRRKYLKEGKANSIINILIYNELKGIKKNPDDKITGEDFEIFKISRIKRKIKRGDKTYNIVIESDMEKSEIKQILKGMSESGDIIEEDNNDLEENTDNNEEEDGEEE